MGKFRRWISLFLALCLLLCAVPALGDSVFLLDLDALDMSRVGQDTYVRQYLSASAQTLRVSKYIGAGESAQASVRLTVLRADTKQTVFDKDYGLIYGTFESGDIYLPYPENGAMYYLITLYLGQWIYALTFLQQLPRLYDNGACTGGFRFAEASGGLSGDWLMGTMLDIEGLRQSGGFTQVPLCASNRYLLGYANVTLSEGRYLSVAIALDGNANAEITRYNLYLIPDVAGVTTVDPRSMPQQSVGLGQAVDVGAATSVLLYLPMTVNYDPALLPVYSYDPSYAQYQLALWEAARCQPVLPESEPFADPMLTEPVVEPVDPALTEPVVEPIDPALTEPVAPPVDPALTESVVEPVDPALTEPQAEAPDVGAAEAAPGA